MTELLEQRYGDTQVEIIWKIKKAFGDNAMGKIQIKKWYTRFGDGYMSVE